jgi:hypothetical protein
LFFGPSDSTSFSNCSSDDIGRPPDLATIESREHLLLCIDGVKINDCRPVARASCDCFDVKEVGGKNARVLPCMNIMDSKNTQEIVGFTNVTG